MEIWSGTYKLKAVGKLHEAEQCIRTAIAETEHAFPQHVHDLCVMYSELGTVLRLQGKLGEAEVALRKAYSIADTVPLSSFAALSVAQELKEVLLASGKEFDVPKLGEQIESLHDRFLESMNDSKKRRRRS